MNNTIEITVPDNLQNERLDVILSRLIDVIPSRSFAAKLIANKQVLVDDKYVKSSYKLKELQKISIDLSFLETVNSEPIGEKIDLDIIFEDNDLIIINKPAGMVVHPGAGVHSGTLVNAILAHCGVTLPSLGLPSRAGIVHRLDRDTSGVMVVAKSQIALTNLSKQFADHSQTRIYHTLIYGNILPVSGKIETWHGRDPKNRIKYAVQPKGKGKKAILSYNKLKTFLDEKISLVACQLYTGRTHQIRVQLSNLGHSILGDALYTNNANELNSNKELKALINKNAQRQMLHAVHLGFKHPVTNVDMSFQSPYPQDFNNLLLLLEAKGKKF